MSAVHVADVLAAAASRLTDAGVDDGRREARLLLAHATTLRPETLFADSARTLDPQSHERFEALIERRARREPMSHLLGVREFWSLDFVVTRDVLDPRPDSETLVEAALDLFPKRDVPLSVLDLGTGTGCLLLAVLTERPRAHGIGIDASRTALAVAEANAGQLGLTGRAQFQKGDWGQGLTSPFDLILCNPPYIPTGEIDRLQPEVAHHEPRLALDGGADGLVAYRTLAPQFKRLLGCGDAAAVVEIGAGQAEAVTSIMRAADLSVTAWRRDLSGVARCIIARASAPFTKP